MSLTTENSQFYLSILQSKLSRPSKDPANLLDLTRTIAEYLQSLKQGEWLEPNKDGKRKWVVSYTKFKHFRDKCTFLEQENKSLKELIALYNDKHLPQPKKASKRHGKQEPSIQ